MATSKEEWRLCAEWLVKCQIIAPEHRVTEPRAEVFDLAQVLRDGVLICHLLNRLQAGAIDPKDFSQRPQMSQFLCLKNIRVFLTTCRSLFGLKESDLFDPYDLFDVRDFGKVISTLSKLSKTAQAQKSNIPGFPPSNVTLRRDSDYYNTLEEKANGFPSEKVVRASSGQQIYRELESLASDIPDDDIYDAVCLHEDDQEIYEDLCSLQRRASHLLPQGTEPKSKRDYCLKELAETESNYVDALQMITQHFIKPMSKLMSAPDHAVVFSCIDELYEIHKRFQSELMKACANQGATGLTIADLFITYREKLLIYGEFCSNLPKSQELIDELCKKRAAIREKVVECQQKANNGKFRLRDLLSVPMQRVLKYHLLLKELIKQTDQSHPQRRGLEQALEAMQDLSLYVNEVKRDNEALELINEIQASITDLEMPGTTRLKDYGKLLKDGELKVQSHEDRRVRIRYIFLFDKVMLMCRSRGDAYNYKNALVLNKFRVDKFRVDEGHKRDIKWTFQFILAPTEGGPAYTFFAKTDDIRYKWIEAINMALDNTNPPGALDGGHEFGMHSFDKPTICDVCRKLLRGVFHQGYKCQKTNLVVHKECIPKAKDVAGPPKPAPKSSVGGPPSPHGGPPTPSPRIERVKVVFDYNGSPPPDNGRQIIELRKGDVLDVLDKSDTYWLKGRLRGEEGYFPAYCVESHRQGPARPPSYEQAKTCAPVPNSFPLSPSRKLSEVDGHRNSSAATVSYVNLSDMGTVPWFVGEMSREMAAKKLERLTSGTFLIRERAANKGAYALSIKFGKSVKHIKVQTGSDDMYFLADCKMFRNIPELVHYYQNNSLHVSFPDLQTTLLVPYKDALKTGEVNGTLGWCLAQYDYSANQPNQLSLTTGERLEIVSKLGGDRGWWKGKNTAGKVGYFPSAYVVEMDDMQ